MLILYFGSEKYKNLGPVGGSEDIGWPSGNWGAALGLPQIPSGTCSDFWPLKDVGVLSSSLPWCGFYSSCLAWPWLCSLSISFSMEGAGQKPQQGPSSCPTAFCCPLLPTANGSGPPPPQAQLGSDTWILAIVFWPLWPLDHQTNHSQTNLPKMSWHMRVGSIVMTGCADWR